MIPTVIGWHGASPQRKGKDDDCNDQRNHPPDQSALAPHLVRAGPRERALDPYRRAVADQDGAGFRMALDMVPIGKGSIVALPFEPKLDTGNPEAGA